MKKIEPVVFPLNLGTATILNCVGNDNFNTSLTIYYKLLSEVSNCLQSGNLSLNDSDYETYNSSSDGNQYIYEWTANQLGLTLVN